MLVRIRVPLECSLPAERVLLALRGEPFAFALTGRWAGGGAIVGCAPVRVLGAEEDPFEALEDLPDKRGDAEVGGGWFGWLGYGPGARVDSRPFSVPDAHLAFYDHVLRRDNEGRWWFEALGDEEEAGGERALSPRLVARLARLRALLAAAPEPAAPASATFSLPAPGAAGHVAATYAGDVAELYAHAAPQLQPAYGACFMTPWGGVASVSPELDRAEVHTGTIGFASPHAGLELNVAIRTFEQHGNRLWLNASGGIAADSDPQPELEECLVRARPLITAIGGHLHQGSDPSTMRNRPEQGFSYEHSVKGSDPLRTGPDPALGVFETLLVADGIAVNLEAHLARLERSVKVLYGEELPRIDVPTDRDGAIRIDYLPGEAPTTTWRELKPRALPIVVTPYVLPGGLGEHKWRDRKLLEALGRDGTTPLILDADGAVLEAAWAAVLIKRDGNLYTPREDGRILPSTSRPKHAEERDLWLQPGDELLLSSSLAGTVPAVLAATTPAPPPGTRRTPGRTAA